MVKKAFIKSFISQFLDLRQDKGDEEQVVESIRKGIDFKGANLWILIFAIFMASLGLNVNSTAVIIGAMLISPLMGPIIGIGLSVGIYDSKMMKRSFKSYLVATLFSIVTATLFFLIFPVAGGQSELLARTSPTVYDVFIALFGGLAGIVALCTNNEKSNVIPGVAIATALMPPLCTAGYAIASQNMNFFLGAFYLYFINSVFISLATFLGVRILRFKRKAILDKKRARRMQQSILCIAILTMIPVCYLTFGIVRSSLYEASVNRFINHELNFKGAQVINRDINYDTKEIRVVMIGEKVPDATLEHVKSKMESYKLGNSHLMVMQGLGKEDTQVDVSSIKAMVMEDFYKKSEQQLEEQQNQIRQLEGELQLHRRNEKISQELIPELRVLAPNVENVAISNALYLSTDSLHSDTLTIALMRFAKAPTEAEKAKLNEWLKARLQVDNVLLVTEK